MRAAERVATTHHASGRAASGQASALGGCPSSAENTQGRGKGAVQLTPPKKEESVHPAPGLASLTPQQLEEEIQRPEGAEETLAATSLGVPDSLKQQQKRCGQNCMGGALKGANDQSAARVKRLGKQKTKQEELIKDLQDQLTKAQTELAKIQVEEEEAKQAHMRVKQQLSSRDDALYSAGSIHHVM